MGELGAASLAKGLESPNAQLRSRCAESLARMGDKALPHMDVLVDRLRDPDTATWKNAGETLASLGGAGAKALAGRLEHLANSDASFRMRIEEVLGWMGEEGARAMALQLEASEAKVRMHAARALGRMGPAATSQSEALARRLANDADTSVRRVAAEALAKLGEAGAVALESCLNVPDAQVRERAAEALQRMGRTELLQRTRLPTWGSVAETSPRAGMALLCIQQRTGHAYAMTRQMQAQRRAALEPV